jgi:hypothetical protein
MTFDERDENRFSAAEIQDVKTIEYTTSEVNPLIQDTVRSVITYIESLKQGCVQAADLFRSSKPHEAWSYLVGVTQGHSDLTEALMALRPHLFATGSAEFQQSWNTAEVHLIHTIRELMNAHEARDFVLMSDILEYELYNALDKWIAILSR